ncbi:MAG: hypothetical protein AAFQ51_19670, partial [Pseudomonadota bacterium]
VGGAGEIGFGQEITNLLGEAFTTLVVFGQERIGYVTGTSSADFDLPIITSEAGAKPYTAQMCGSPTYLDDRGIRDMSTTENFGNWRTGTLSTLVEPWFKSARLRGATPVASMRVRARDQYRIFYSDGTGLTVYFGRRNVELLPFTLPHPPVCAASGTIGDEERLFFGTADGMVYEMDRPPSFDGQEVLAFVRSPFLSFNEPTREQRLHSVTVDCDAPSGADLYVSAEMSYGNPDLPASSEEIMSQPPAGGGFWDTALWDQALWSASVHGRAIAHINGLGQNISVVISSESATDAPHTLTAATINVTSRRLRR